MKQVSVNYMLNLLAGMKFPGQGEAYDFVKEHLQEGTIQKSNAHVFGPAKPVDSHKYYQCTICGVGIYMRADESIYDLALGRCGVT